MTPAELEYMAVNGYSARVYALVRQFDPDRRRACSSPQVLRQAVVGGLAAARALPESAAARAQAIDLVDELMQRHLALAPRGPSRELLRSLLDWTRFLFAESRLPEAEAAADLGLERSAGHPDVYGRFVLEKAACLGARGDNTGAYAMLDALYARWDLVSDRGVLPDLALALGRAALLTGRAAEFKRSLFDGLRRFYGSVQGRRAVFDLLRALMFAFFSAPILFKPEIFPAGSLQATLLAGHPLTYLAALFQKPIYAARWPDARDWAISALTAASALSVGAAALWRCRARLYFYV